MLLGGWQGTCEQTRPEKRTQGDAAAVRGRLRSARVSSDAFPARQRLSLALLRQKCLFSGRFFPARTRAPLFWEFQIPNLLATTATHARPTRDPPPPTRDPPRPTRDPPRPTRDPPRPTRDPRATHGAAWVARGSRVGRAWVARGSRVGRGGSRWVAVGRRQIWDPTPQNWSQRSSFPS